MLLFRSEETANRWCERNATPRRPILTIDQLWFLSLAWYSNRLTVESRRPAPDEMVGIFGQIGLKGEFWNPKADSFRAAP
jgi:hypothetical protein